MCCNNNLILFLLLILIDDVICWFESPIDGQYSVIWSSIDSLTEPLANYLDFTQINNTCIKKKIAITESYSF